MGDSGALLLGALMAVSTSVVGGRADTTQEFTGQTYFFFAPLFIPLFILGVPILDTLFAIVRRATSRQGLATADKGHLHHRLMNLGPRATPQRADPVAVDGAALGVRALPGAQRFGLDPRTVPRRRDRASACTPSCILK